MVNNIFLKNKVTAEFISSISIICLVFIVSLAGIVYHDQIYSPIQNINNLATDWFNILIILPLLIATLFLISKNNLLALLLWPGLLLYFVFIYLFYLISISFQWISLSYLVITPLSGYTTIGIVGKINSEKTFGYLEQLVPTTFAGGLLILFGVFFILLDIGNIINSLDSQSIIPLDTYVPWIVDFTVGIPLLLIVGVIIIQKKQLGYVLGPGLLLYVILLDLGVSILYIFKWLYHEPDFDIFAMVIFSIITLVCIFPFYVYKRNELKTKT